MKKICKTIWNIIIIIVIVVSSLITLISVISGKDGIPNLNGYSPFTIQSNSMYPSLKKGDLIVVKLNHSMDDYKIGDIISFYAYESGENIIKTHRISNIVKENNMILFETKGDNNDINDVYLVTEVDMVGKYIKRIPYLGKIIDILKNKYVFLIGIIIPLLIIFITELISFINLYIEYKIDEMD